MVLDTYTYYVFQELSIVLSCMLAIPNITSTSAIGLLWKAASGFQNSQSLDSCIAAYYKGMQISKISKDTGADSRASTPIVTIATIKVGRSK